MRIGLAILNRNEEVALPHVLPTLDTGSVDMVFAVDGDSSDSSPGLLRNAGIEVVEQRAPGRGEAFRIAFEHARPHVDALVFFSPDGNEDTSDLSRFREGLEAGNDIVIASRMMPGAVNEEDQHWFRPRKWANLFFDWLAYLVWGLGQQRITDAINGYRAITVDAWDRLSPDGPAYTIEYQTSIRAYKASLAVHEFPTVEGQRIGGESEARALETGLRFLRLFWSELVRSLR